MPLDTLGGRLYQARLDAGAARGRPITQGEVGEILGVHQVTVGEWERDRNQPKLEMIAKLAALYNVTASWLAFGVEAAGDEPRVEDASATQSGRTTRRNGR